MLYPESSDEFFIEIFDDIILGKSATRLCHNLVYDGKIYTDLFMERLRYNRFWPRLVSKVNVDMAHRIPAFYITKNMSLFGYISWEIIDHGKMFKIWRSELKDNTGRWKHIITSQQDKIVWVNLNRKEKK
jgi:hypothetical protein